MSSRQRKNGRTTAVALAGAFLLLASWTAAAARSVGASAFALRAGGGLPATPSPSLIFLRDEHSLSASRGGRRRFPVMTMRGTIQGGEGFTLRRPSPGGVGSRTMGRDSQHLHRCGQLSNSIRSSRTCVPGRCSVALAASSVPINPSNLAVSIDRPLISSLTRSARGASNAPSSLWPSFLSVLVSDVARTAIIAFFLAAGLSLATRVARASASGEKFRFPFPDLTRAYKAARGRVSRVADALSRRRVRGKGGATSADEGIPMPFGGDGWGKCTLQSKRSVGQSSYVECEFDLPRRDYSLPLVLGQSLDFCCLDGSGDVMKGSFYPATSATGSRAKTGSFSIVVPNKGSAGNEKVLGRPVSQFVEVLQGELQPGDEVAIKPGKSSLSYRGEHIPVTDIVYLASGMGIVPIVDQVKAILPDGFSSVEVASVVWINDDRDDFDLAVDELEREYFKYSTKLAVSCVVEDANPRSRGSMEENPEIDEAVPYFNIGTMAVVSGPKHFSDRAKSYLTRKGYPEDCICILS